MPADKKKYPNIIFLDGVPSKRLGGISQTLYNLFNGYPQQNLFALIDKNQEGEVDENSLECTKVKIRVSTFPYIKKRFVNKINPFFDKLNAFLRDVTGIKIEASKLPVDAFLLICTTNISKLHAAKIIHKKYKYPLLTYFMDDWTADVKFNWWLGDIDELVKYSLNNALGRLMISEALNKSLNDRYVLNEKPTYIVHNPVDLTKAFVKPSPITAVDKVKIIYAGSIWDMHLDAIVLVIDAIGILNTKGGKQYELCIYSNPGFWEHNNSKLNKPGVVFGGFVLYQDLDAKLATANLLLVASSFLKKFEAFSRSSVQTKLTDYMKNGIPVLSVGPTYGACNWFVNKWQCGFTWQKPDNAQLANFLEQIMADDITYQTYAQNAYDVVKQNFNKQIIQKQLTEFIGSLQ